MEDIPVVLDAVGSERAAMITNIGGGIIAMPFAAAHPERVSSLILVDCFARFLEAPDFPIGAPVRRLMPASRGSLRTTRPRRDDRPVRAVGRGRQRTPSGVVAVRAQAATPGSTEAIVRLIYESDVRDVLPAIRVPTLVIHRRMPSGSASSTGAISRAHRGVRYVELPGADNLIWAGDQDAIVAEIQAFVTGVRPVPEPDACWRRCCSPTSSARRDGQPSRATPWEALLADHNRIVRRSWIASAVPRSRSSEMASLRRSTALSARSVARSRSATRLRELGLEIRAGSTSARSRCCATISPGLRSTSVHACRRWPGPEKSSYRAR